MGVAWVVALGLVVGAVEAPPALPAAGYVRLPPLVAADAGWARVEGLLAAAAELRAGAARVDPLLLPAVPAEPTLVRAADAPADDDIVSAGREMELEFLKEAYLAQVEAEHRRAQEMRLPQWQREWLADRRQQRLQFLTQSAAMAAAQGPERANLSVEAALSTGPIAQSWAVDANALGAAEAALDQLWERAAERRAVEALRTRLADQAAELAVAEADALVAAQAELALQSEDLAGLAERMAEARAAAAREADGAVLDLAAWEAEVAAAQARSDAERAATAERWRAAAVVWEAAAEELRAELQAELPKRLGARLRALARAQRVRLELAPEPGLPDVTDLAGLWLDGLEEHPEWLAPALPVGPPTLDVLEVSEP